MNTEKTPTMNTEKPNIFINTKTATRKQRIGYLKKINKGISWFYFIVNPYTQNYSNVSIPVPISNERATKLKTKYRNKLELNTFLVKNELTKYHYFNAGKFAKLNPAFRKIFLQIFEMGESELNSNKNEDFKTEYDVFMTNLFNITSYIMKCYFYAPLKAPIAVNFLLSTIFFSSVRDKFKSTYKQENIYSKKMLLLITLILDISTSIINVDLRKQVSMNLPNYVMTKYFSSEYQLATTAFKNTAKTIRDFVSTNLLNDYTIKYYDQMLDWVKLKYQLIYVPYITKVTVPAKNTLVNNVVKINKQVNLLLQMSQEKQGIAKIDNETSGASESKEEQLSTSIVSSASNKLVDSLVDSLLDIVGGLLFPGKHVQNSFGSHESLQSNTNKINSLILENNKNITWSLWSSLFDVVE